MRLSPYIRNGAIALLSIAVLFIAYILYEDHKKLLQISKVPTTEKIISVTQPVATPIVDTTLKKSLWSMLQAKTRDTVAQVFAHIAEFDWLQPYRAPNQYQVTGSAFFINDNGQLITNAHVVDQAKGWRVFLQLPSLGKRQLEAEVIGISPERDLAFLELTPESKNTIKQILGRIPFLSLGDSDQVHRAEEVMALGYPLGQQALKSTTGDISGREHIAGQYLIQISAPINPGNSGGPALDINGEVIGVCSSGFPAAQNVGYIIPSNDIKLFINQLQKLPATNSVKVLHKPFLGVLFSNATEDLTTYLGNPTPGGLYVVDACKSSPLEKAGVQGGDMIYEINGHRLDIYGEMSVPWSEDKISIVDYISRLVIGEKVDLTIYRNGKRKSIQLVFTEPNQNEWPLRKKRIPGIDYDPKAYEVIAGMVIMPFALNHIPYLINTAPQLSKYTDIKNQMEPALIITHILANSMAARSRSILPGAIISEVNGKPVKTIEELREAIRNSAGREYFTIKTTDNIPMVFPLKKMLEQEPRTAMGYYPLSRAMKDLLEKENMLPKKRSQIARAA